MGERVARVKEKMNHKNWQDQYSFSLLLSNVKTGIIINKQVFSE
jgi:hypothetical protein